MTTEKFTNAAETFTKNVNDTMKWLQNTTATVFETQAQQMKSASEMYNKVVTSAIDNIQTFNWSNSAWISETVAEIFQKNVEAINNLSKTTLKTAWEFGQQAETEKYTKEAMTKIADAYKKQIEEISAYNKKSFEKINTQFAGNETWSTWTEKFKTEFENTVETSKTKVKEIVETYNKVSNPTVESNKEFFNTLNTQLTSSVNENIKLWSEFTNAYTAKFNEAKNTTEFFNTTTVTPSATAKTKKTVEVVDVVNN